MEKTPQLSKEEYIQRIRELLWSNDPINDKLVLEIVKYNEMYDELIPDFIAVVLIKSKHEVQNEFYAFLRKHVADENKEVFQMISSSKFRRRDPLSSVLDKYAKHAFNQILYTGFRRGIYKLEEYLMMEDGTSSYRKEVFERYFRKVLQNPNQNLEFPGLTKEEMKIMLNHPEFQKKDPKRITIHGNKIVEIPKEVFAFQNITTWYFHNVSLNQFPKELLHHKASRHIYFLNVPFQTIPSDWSNLDKLEILSLQSSKLHFKDLTFINTLPNLKEVVLKGNYLENLYLLMTPRKLPISNWKEVQEQICYPFNQFLSFSSALYRCSSLQQIDKFYFFDLVKDCSALKEIPELSVNEILKALCINFPPLRELCLHRLHKITQQQNGLESLGKSANLMILGNTSMTKTEIRKKLKGLGIGYSTSLSDKVTHLLIGKNPKMEKYDASGDFQLITETQLQTYFSETQPQFLEKAAAEGENQMQENLLGFLRSPEPANAMVGLEMLKSGGVPDDLLEELLVVQKTASDSKVRATAKKLLERYAPEEWQALIRDKQHFAAITQKAKEQDLNNKLKKVAKLTSRHLAAMLSLAMFKVHRRGLRYILYSYKKPHDWRTKAFEAIMKNGHLDYSAGLGFTNLRDREPVSLIIYGMKLPALFPADALDYFEKIESINFHNCKMDKLHIGIGKFKDLKHLDCSCNVISQLPKTIKKLEKLESLNLYANQFLEFPEEVAKLKNLKKLDLRYNGSHNRDATIPLEIPAEVKAALPNCEILV